MRYFTNNSQLARLDFNNKLLATYFLLFMLLATGFSIVMSYQRSRLDTAAAVDYYRGNEERMMFPKESTELMETTHFHLFMTPLIFLTTAHLFLLGAWSRKWKTVVITSCFVYVVFDIAKPWLIRYVAVGFGFLAPLNSALLGTTMLLCIAVPLYEMWFLKVDAPTRPH
ncbi:MAG: hypothetical protein CME15_15830 [Gemmatimonadetes bacterium]|jgi:hypothetical protein|nr:hypothetical protein [Gemmatimonadota bacterium]|tara:strand:+ start:131 stop:637 length:507 start_codon:yes stop_codon:yes gene_type:complete